MGSIRNIVAGLVLVALCAAGELRASPESDLVGGILRETQMMGGDGTTQRMVWWIPTEFWVSAARQSPGASEAQTQQIATLLDRYVMVAVMQGEIGPLGGMTFMAEADLRAAVAMLDAEGRKVDPLRDKDIDVDTRNFVSMMQPMLTNLLGPLGQNVHFVLYPGKSKGGARYADPRAEGIFHIELGGERYSFRTPLGALLPRKVCPKDGEALSGAWKYCPRHGLELQAPPQPKP